MTKITFDLKKFEDWLERQGCDCCTMGAYHIEKDGIYFRWTSMIQKEYGEPLVVTEHDDKQIECELV